MPKLVTKVELEFVADTYNPEFKSWMLRQCLHRFGQKVVSIDSYWEEEE